MSSSTNIHQIKISVNLAPTKERKKRGKKLACTLSPKLKMKNEKLKIKNGRCVLRTGLLTPSAF